MKRIILPILVLIVVASCNKKDTYGYTCTCTDKDSGKADTTYTIRVETSGEASYVCRDYADTANYYGKNIDCTIK